MPNSGITAGTVGRLVLDAGMLYHHNTQQGVLGGVVTFDPGIELRNVPFANKTNDIEGLDRVIRYNATLTVGFKEITDARVAAHLPGSVITGVSPATVVTPVAAGTFQASIANVRAIFRMGATGPAFFEIRFAKAFPELGSLGSDDPGEGTWAVTYRARATVASPDAAPFTFHWHDTTIPTL